MKLWIDDARPAQKEDERKWCQPWELMMFEDLEALGIKPGEVDY